MNPPADPLQLSQEEQRRLLARVYAFILSDQFTGIPQEQGMSMDSRSSRKRKTQSTRAEQVLDAKTIVTQEPAL